MNAIVGPVALYNNLPIAPQNYQPWTFPITAVALGDTTTVTVSAPSTTDLNYFVGQQVRLLIPPTFGCRQLNQKLGYVISIPGVDQVEIDIDSTKADAYIASSATTTAQLVAVGDINSGRINSQGRKNNATFIKGSFINISPQ